MGNGCQYLQPRSDIGLTIISKCSHNIGLKISFVFLILAAVDYYYQRRKFKNDMKMTKQEVKEEYKNTEGNPQIKSRIRSKMQEVSRARMMQSVPEADVVITNPTHLAVAIKVIKILARRRLFWQKVQTILPRRSKILQQRIKWKLLKISRLPECCTTM